MSPRPVSATIIQREPLSANVLGLTLGVPSGSLRFQPGQWIDFQIQGQQEVGGFSITSTPRLLQEESSLTLAVKKSRSPVTQWLHEEARVGDRATIAVGGDCYYDAQKMPGPLLLMAGGIGITPLISIFRHVRETEPNKTISLLYTAKHHHDLNFREEIKAASVTHRNVTVAFAVTGEDRSESRRFDRESIGAAMSRPRDTHVFICGPSAMLTALPAEVHRLGVPETQIHFESWW